MRYELDFDETFEGTALDPSRWLPYYIPHWSSRERAAARYAIGGGALRLRIDADQEPWCPELDGEVRVSSVQTGAFAGPVGSTVGQESLTPIHLDQPITDAGMKHRQPGEQMTDDLIHLIVGKPLTLHTDNVGSAWDGKGSETADQEEGSQRERVPVSAPFPEWSRAG